MATVEDLYRQVLGREPDPEGLAFWKSAFGGSVDPTEQASFMQSVQSVLASAPAAQQATLAPNLASVTPVTQQTTLAPNLVSATNVANPLPSQPMSPPNTGYGTGYSIPVNPTVKLYQDTLGRTPTQEEIDSWNFGDTIDARELDRFLGAARNEAVNTMPTTGAVGKIASEILAQGTTDKWGGEGFGSATKNAYDMGVMLAGQGLTSINDFGQRTTADGNKEFFNKATGEAIKPYYDKAAKVGPDVWGGTFAGKDSTAYGVQFDANGKPLFYSQYGGDSADVPSWVVPALVLGGAYFGLGGLEGLLGGSGGSLTAGITAADIAAAEAALPTLSGAGAAAGATGLLGGSLTAGITAADIAAGEAALPSAGSLTAGITAADIAAGEAGLPVAESLTAGLTAAQIAAAEAALPTAGGATNIGNIFSNLTPGQIANIAGGVGGLLGGAGVARAVTGGGGTGGGVGALPTQGVPLNTADYYNAIQQNYNRLLPAVPRDVATPLAQWYNSTYGA